jgi:dihydroorotase
MNQALCDMPTLLAKFLAMGMPLKEVVLRATWNPAQVIHHPEVGHLTAGSAADIAVWRVIEGRFGFSDSYGGRLEGRQRLVCEMTLKGGDVAWNWGALGLTDYRKLGPEYGLREGIDAIVRPPR